MTGDPQTWRGPGRPVQASQDGYAYTAWLPDPLPPALGFDAELATRLGTAAGALGQLSGAGSNLANPLVLMNPFLRKEAVLSSRIEGTQATIADLYAYEAQLPLPGMAPPRERQGDVREVFNYVDALNRGLDMIQDYPVSLALIQELHLHLMRDVRGRERTPGEFRVTQNIIGPDGATLETATYIPPPPMLLPDVLEALETYLRSDESALHPLIRIAAIHYQFEAIHPFGDGNGRVGRLLVSLLLVYWGLLPLPLLYLSAYLERHRLRYYELLRGVTEQGDWRAWLLFFLTGVAEQSVDATVRARRLHELRDSLQRRAVEGRAAAGAVVLAGRLVEQPILSINGAVELLHVKYHNARRQVHKLVELGLLKPLGNPGHEELYLADEVMLAVDA